MIGTYSNIIDLYKNRVYEFAYTIVIWVHQHLFICRPRAWSWGRNREETWNFIINFYLVYVYIYNLCNFPTKPLKENHPRILSLKLTLIHFQIFLYNFHDIPISWTFVITHEISQRFSQFLGENHQALTSIGFHRGHTKRSEKLKTVASADRAETIQIVGVFWHLNYHSYRELWYVMMLVL